jgi:sugar-specific transcriptional regulator TrmB
MENTKILKDLGLTEPEAQAYLTLLKMGGSLASSVAQEMGVKRTTVYATLKSLAAKGLVLVYFRKNKHFYYAVQPHKVASQFEKKLETFNDLVPLLQSLEKKQTQQVGLRFIETKEELKQYYLGILDKYKNSRSKEYQVISNDLTWENIDKDFFIKFRKDRDKLGIKVKLLFSYDCKQNVDASPKLGRVFKFFPSEYPVDCSIEIFQNEIALISHELSSVAVIISIQPIVSAFKAIFEILWKLIPEEE